MSRKPFSFIVAVLILFVGYTLVVGARLPGALRRQIETEQHQLDDAKRQIAGDRATVTREAGADPELFRVRGFDTQWPASFSDAAVALDEAQRYATRLSQILHANRRSDKAQAEDLLQRERSSRETAVRRAGGVLTEANRRAALKAHFSETLKSIETGAERIQTADTTATAAAVHQAEVDWPAKKEDLDSRLTSLLNAKKQAADWDAAAKSLEAKPAAQLTAADYAQALDTQESLESERHEDPQQLAGMTHQLYTSWDDVLVDLDKDPYRERVKHVVTTVSAPAEKGATTSSESWRDVPRDSWVLVENNLGMTIAHKPLGKYDTEADHTPQPSGFAYMASPAEGRNRYGYWENGSGGSFWHWLPEYLILRDLLSNRSYVPVPSYDWNHYRQAQQYGRTYYGTEVSGAPKYGSHGTFTQQHYSASRYVQSGGFSGSKYAAGGRSMPSMGDSGSTGRKFGAATGESGGHHFGGGSSGRSFGSASRSAGRSFGRRR